MTINPNRPVEELAGSNYGIVRQKLGRIHCMTSVLSAARQVRPHAMRDYPVALRRGWAKCVIETLAEYRGTYVAVTRGNLSYTCKLGAFD